MSIITSTSNGIFIMMPNGNLDTNTAPEAEQVVTEAINSGEKRVVVDFAKTEYISSAGLRVILKIAKMVKPDGAVALCNANDQIQEVLEISGFLSMIQSLSSLDDAMQAIGD